MARNVGSLRVAQMTAKKWKPQSYNQKEMNSANSKNEIESRFNPRASRRELSPANTLILALRDCEQRT